jgi:hypothetical protein
MAGNQISTGHRVDGEAAKAAGPGRWIGLAVVSVAQLMVALDATVMNIALPSAQRGPRHPPWHVAAARHAQGTPTTRD